MAHELEAYRPLTRTPLSVQVSRRLRDAIVSGDLGVGTELPTEKELTDSFGVSRSTIREALRILQAQGLLSGGDTVSTSRPRVSAELTVPIAAEALENVLRLGRVPLADLVELRLLLEGAGLGRASADAAEMEDARRALEEMRRPGVDVGAFHDADVRFHISLAGAGGNRAFPLVMNVLRHALATHLLQALGSMGDPQPTLDRLAGEHAAILEAVEHGDDALAVELLRSHVHDFYAHEVARP
jgi:DNA-binding FadR family transcriptional regulator